MYFAEYFALHIVTQLGSQLFAVWEDVVCFCRV